MSLVWSREPYNPKRQTMSVERIVQAAITLADAEGLDAVTMRKVATALGSGTTSLYRYLENRDELLDLMVDAVRSGEAAEPSGDWRADLSAIAREQRELLLRHPWLGQVLSTRPALGPNSLRHMDRALAAAEGLTSDVTLAGQVTSLIFDYVLGATSRQLADTAERRRTGLSTAQWRASVAPYIQEVIASGAYPHFARRVVEADDPGFTDQFEYGLERLLAGLAPA